MPMRNLRRSAVHLSGLLFSLAVLSLNSTAQTSTQPGEWTWLGGGPLGPPAAGNLPTARWAATASAGKNGHGWLFGGELVGASLTFVFNDLWEFDPSTDEWTWRSGSSQATLPCVGGMGGGCSQPGVYGTMGQPAAGNVPGSRWGASSWVDGNGNFWLFGGAGYSVCWILNDLWKFNTSTNQWTWMNGNNIGCDPGVYGTLGATANVPPDRYGASQWIDGNGHLWLFGGTGIVAPNYAGEFNDLWQFDPSTSEWTWMAGSNPADAPKSGCPGTYGSLGTPSPGNTPGAREYALSWTGKDGLLWLFGGSGSDANGVPGFLNDLWQFNPATSEWTWISGSSTGSASGIYGTLGILAPANTPSGREASAGWTDSLGNLWLFGGEDDDAAPESGNRGYRNDLWVFNPLSAQWAWMAGSDTIPPGVGGQPVVYGTLGVPAAANDPGGRASNTAWTDANGNLWLFGGAVYGGNDLWVYQPPDAAIPSFDVAPGTYNAAKSVTLSDTTPGATIYYTTDGTTPTTSSTVFSDAITVSASETLEAIAATSIYASSPVAAASYTIVPPPAATPAFSVPAGTYTTVQTVTIADATTNATVYYTTDGTAPTASSSVYSGPITVSSTETLEAIATANGFSTSAITSAAYTINLPPADFTVAPSPASITVTAGASGTTSISATPQNGFNSAVSFACSGLPAGALCSFSPATVTPSGASASTTLTIATSAALHSNRRSLVPVAALACAFLWLSFGKRRHLRMLVLLAGCAAGLSLLGASGGGGSSQPVTSTITITASSGSLQHTATISLTVN